MGGSQLGGGEGCHTASLDLRNPRFRGAVASLAAPIHGLPKDELDGEDLRQHRTFTRVRRAAVAALAVLLMGAVAASIVAVVQAGIARDNEDEALLQADIAKENEAEARECSRVDTASCGGRGLDGLAS